MPRLPVPPRPPAGPEPAAVAHLPGPRLPGLAPVAVPPPGRGPGRRVPRVWAQLDPPRRRQLAQHLAQLLRRCRPPDPAAAALGGATEGGDEPR